MVVFIDTLREYNDPDTPAKVRSVHSSTFSSSTLQERRDAVLEDIRVVHEISMQDFIEALLPELPEGIIPEQVLAAVKEDSNPLSTFFNFTQTKEDKAYEPFASLFTTLVEKATNISNRPPTFAYIAKPSNAPSVPGRESKHRPDALVYKKGTSWESYFNIGPTWEYKKVEGDAAVNDVSEAH